MSSSRLDYAQSEERRTDVFGQGLLVGVSVIHIQFRFIGEELKFSGNRLRFCGETMRTKALSATARGARAMQLSRRIKPFQSLFSKTK